MSKKITIEILFIEGKKCIKREKVLVGIDLESTILNDLKTKVREKYPDYSDKELVFYQEYTEEKNSDGSYSDGSFVDYGKKLCATCTIQHVKMIFKLK